MTDQTRPDRVVEELIAQLNSLVCKSNFIRRQMKDLALQMSSQMATLDGIQASREVDVLANQ